MKKTYTSPVLKVVNLSTLSIFCGCGSHSTENDSCYN